MDDRSPTSFVEDGRHGPDPTTDGDELWRVFVLLRHHPGVYARAVRASGPLDAERAVGMVDQEVLGTLGSQLLRRHVTGGAEPRYQSLEPVGRRYWVVHQKGPSGSSVIASVPTLEVLTTNPGRLGLVEGSGTGSTRPSAR